MKVAWLDTFSGISGDMTLGAFLSAGVPFAELEASLMLLGLDGWSLRMRTIERSMISAVKLDVLVGGEIAEPPSEHASEHDYLHGQGSDALHHGQHAQDHDSHPHEHSLHPHEHSSHPHEHGLGHVHRSYADIVRLIDDSRLSNTVKERAKGMFLTIGKAESKIHGTSIEKIHFHEVGAVDSIIDIVGVAICMELAGIERLYTSRIRTGSGGFITTQHGVMPIPTPATLEILEGYPIELTSVPYELTTPTGAAIVKTLSSGVLEGGEQLTVESVGYGAGGRTIPGLPNLLRLVIGSMPDNYASEPLVVLETNIDDMNPEIYPWLLERLMDSGAHDAFLTPVLMKKGRPGQLLTVTCSGAFVERLIDVICRESTTTGVRIREVGRRKLPRDVVIMDSRFGPVSVKVIVTPTGTRRVPEFEECRRIAGETGMPLRDVYTILERELA